MPTVEALRARYEALPDRALLQIVTVDAADYREDALEAARDELRKRGVEITGTTQFLDSMDPEELREGPHFCARCREATSDDRFPASGEAFMRRLLDPDEPPCNECGSVVREHYFAPFRIAVVCLAKYRVKLSPSIWPADPRIIASRKLREA